MAFADGFRILIAWEPPVKLEVTFVNREAMRKHMEEVRDELNKAERQKLALEHLLRAYEEWFKAFPENGAKPHRQLTFPPVGRGGKPKGAISFRKAEIEVLQQARGEPLRDEEIWLRMQEAGVRSDAKNPLGFVNLTARRIPDVEKVAAKTWRWKGTASATNNTSGEGHQLVAGSPLEGR